MVERGVGSNPGRVMKFGFAKLISGSLRGDRVGEGRGRVVGGGVLGVLGPASAPFAAGAPSM